MIRCPSLPHLAVIGLTGLVVSSQALAQENEAPSPENCAKIEDDAQRLVCYDLQTAKKDKTQETVEKAEKSIFSFTGGFVSHRPNYILPISWVRDPNPYPVSPGLGTSDYGYELEKEEAKYQISFKVPLLTGLFEDGTTFWFGYTQKSFWQVYNQDDSAPFRETNYEPELFFRQKLDWDLGPGTLDNVTFGFNHQSNGQSDPESRSWNRIMASATYRTDNWLFMVKPWYKLPENDKDEADNADIEDYLGYASYHVIYEPTEGQTLSMKMMNNLQSTNRTSVELGYSFPLGETIKGFIQYYNGYGESLIDYNHRIERVGIGIMLNDWL